MRLDIVNTLRNRASSSGRDARMLNVLAEMKGEKKRAFKRPALSFAYSSGGSGSGQMLFVFGDIIVTIRGDNMNPSPSPFQVDNVYQSTLYTTSNTFPLGPYAQTFYNGVVWISETVSGSFARQTLVFNFASQSTPINTIDDGGQRAVIGTISEETLPPGYAILISGTVALYRIAFNESTPLTAYVNIGFDSNNIVGATSDQDTMFVGLNGGGITRFSGPDWSAHSVTQNSVTLTGYTNGALASNAGVIDSRIYVHEASASVSGKLSWVHSGTLAVTSVRTWDSLINKPLLAGQFGGGADTVILVESGNTGKENVIEKLNLDGTVLSQITLTDLPTGSGARGQITEMAYDYLNDVLWARAGTKVFAIAVTGMTLLATKTVSNIKLLTPIGHPSGGAFTIESADGGSTYTSIGRIYF